MNITCSIPQLAGLFCFAHNLAQSGFKSSRDVSHTSLLRHSFHFVQSVPERGLEPPCLAAYAPEAYVATNYTTPAMVNSVAGLGKKGRGKLNLARSRNQNKNTIIYDSIFSNIVVTSC